MQYLGKYVFLVKHVYYVPRYFLTKFIASSRTYGILSVD